MSVSLVLGGARSRKSRYAESLLIAHPTVTYVDQHCGPAQGQGRAEQGDPEVSCQHASR